MLVLARLLSPYEYGLVGMVAPVLGFLRVFRDAGLYIATIQREKVTPELMSTVFWLNLVIGLAVTVLLIPLAWGLVKFYNIPELRGITLALAIAFALDAVMSQHQALLRRAMRFKTQAIIDITGLLAGVATGIGMAIHGCGYWSLIGLQAATSTVGAIGVFLAEPWLPGWPQRGTGAGTMARFGRLVTGANLLNYIFRNADNVLIGWRFGPEPLGLYQKAYGLLMLPINQVNAPIGNVAIVTLSRLQTDPERLRRYFIGGYTVIASLALPIVTGATLFASDIIRFVLGEKWTAAIPIFQFLAPAALIGALLNPFGWLYISLGRADRQLRCAVVWCTLVVAAFFAGLRYGPEGVAIAYSGISVVLALPICLYGLHGTPIRLRDLGEVLLRPALAVVLAGGAMWALKLTLPAERPAAIGAIGGCLGLVALYAFLLLVVFRQWSLYRDLVPHIFQRRKTART